MEYNMLYYYFNIFYNKNQFKSTNFNKKDCNKKENFN